MDRRFLSLAIMLTLSIIYVSSISDRPLGHGGSTIEQIVSNLAHVPVYALLAFLWVHAFKRKGDNKRLRKTDLLILAGLVLFAVSDEIHQSFIPGRSASLMDFGLNMFGIILGLKLFQRKSS